ncbi:MAG: potassium channel protein [Proteobacteria bacterium]|nr:potassium channel protein [Pseudomonadota bacterium]
MLSRLANREQGGTRDRNPLGRAAAALALVLLSGTLGFAAIEGWSLWQSLYFTLVTITTVGYGDEGISQSGRVLAAGLLVSGIGVASYTLAAVVEQAAAWQLSWRRRMKREIDQLRDHVIVCGFGRMGRTVCDALAAEEKTFVVVESRADAFREALDAGHLAVEGSGAEDEILMQAGLDRAAHLVAATDSDTENIVIALTSRELNPAIEVIARAEQEGQIRKLRRAGANRTISPFRSGGLEIAQAILQPAVADFLARSHQSNGQLALAEIPVALDSQLAGRSLRDYGANEGSRVSFVALERGDGPPLIPPRGEEVLRGGDLLIVAGAASDIMRMRSHAGADHAG